MKHTLTFVFLLLLMLPNVFAAEQITVRAVEGTQDYKQGQEFSSGTKFKLKSGAITLSLGRDVVTRLSGGVDAQIEVVKDKDWALHLNSGSALSVVKNPEKRENHFSVSTRAAVMGVRGTAFYVQAESTGAVNLCTCKGVVRVSSANGKLIREVKSTHHEHQFEVSHPDQKIHLEGTHTDEQILALEHLWSNG